MSGAARHGRALALAVLGAVLGACEFGVPAASYIGETKLIAVIGEVTELGPLNPARVAGPSSQPVAEPMPHDRYAFEAVVVDADGRALARDDIESLWLQCGVLDCGEVGVDVASPSFDRRCAELDPADGDGPWTMDSVCVLGEGDGRFEFVVPELGPAMADVRRAQYYGVIAWGERTARECWDARRERDEVLDECGFAQRGVKIGPSWWLLAYAETLGYQPVIPVVQLPAPVLVQAANRVPAIDIDVLVDGVFAGVYPERASFAVTAGARIQLSVDADPSEQFQQTYFVAKRVPDTDSWYFVPALEFTFETFYTTNDLHMIGEYPLTNPVPEFAVDGYASAGRSRILIVYFDDRGGEGVAVLEFEVDG